MTNLLLHKNYYLEQWKYVREFPEPREPLNHSPDYCHNKKNSMKKDQGNDPQSYESSQLHSNDSIVQIGHDQFFDFLRK